jgi:hypothetical protein
MLPIDPSRHVVKKTLAKLVSGIEPRKKFFDRIKIAYPK